MFDFLKANKVTRLTLDYLEQIVDELRRDPDLETALLTRYCFNAEAAVNVLVAKIEKAMQRIKLDRGLATPSNTPPHLQHVTN